MHGPTASWRQLEIGCFCPHATKWSLIVVHIRRPAHFDGKVVYEEEVVLDQTTTLGDLAVFLNEIASRKGWEHIEAQKNATIRPFLRVTPLIL